MNISHFSNYGFLFEFGFNVGMLSFIKEEVESGRANINKKYIDYLESNINNKKYTLVNIHKMYTNNIINENSKEFIKSNIEYIVFKGFLSGKNFLNEFITSKVDNRKYNIEYFQVNFIDPFNNLTVNDCYSFYRRCIKEQLNLEIDRNEFYDLSKKGEFLKADSILCISIKNKYYICTLDNSIHIKNAIKDYKDIENIKLNYKNNIYKKRSKSCFTNLNIDASGYIDLSIDEYFTNYLTVFNQSDKGIYKSIQAGSYANSFIKYLLNNKKIGKENIESISLIGYTDEDFTSINIGKYDLDKIEIRDNNLLKLFNNSYKKIKSNDNDELRNKIYKNISRNFNKSFGLDKNVRLMKINDGLDSLNISTKYKDYQNTADEYEYEGEKINFRDCHALEIKKYIKDKSTNMIFLTGNPGIGKTTTIKDYLKDEDSYIFIYISPRIQVNKDIEQKFMNKDNRLYCDDLICLSASSNDETYINSKSVDIVNFIANNNLKFEKIKEPIMFLNSNREKNFECNKAYFKKLSSNEFIQGENTSKGVLNRLTKSIDYIISNNLSNKIVATASIQSLKIINNNKSTASHIENIFKSVKTRNGSIDIESYRKFSKRYKNIFFMIDEITGDKSGVEFLNKVNFILYDELYNKLSDKDKEDINFKIIVADASINNKDIINKHICSSKKSEGNKIYYKKIDKEESNISSKKFLFNKKYKAICINTNSYPAKSLTVDYSVIHNTRNIDNNELDINTLKHEVNKEIAIDCINSIENHKQIIVYIQDKKRLNDVKNILNVKYEHKFDKKLKLNEDYIIINSSLSRNDRESVLRYKDKVKFIFMTSSASRGISFKYATKILIDTPTYNIEMNLMEILQLIYRGRGDSYIDQTYDKYVKFYIQNNIYYSHTHEVSNRHEKIMESIISLMSIMMIIKIAIETRIKGYGIIGKHKCELIPIGSKGLEVIDDLGIDMFSNISKNLKKEIYKDSYNQNLDKVIKSLENIFSKISVETYEDIFNNGYRDMDSIYNDYISKINHGIHNLLNFNPFKDCYILGELMIFKVNKEIKVLMHFIRDLFEIEIESINLLDRIYALSKDDSLSDNIRYDMNKTYKTLKYYLEQNKDSMDYINRSSIGDRYVAIPMIYMFYIKEFYKYFKKGEGEDCIRNILENYVKSYYDINSVLPITCKYEDIPFITFKSNSIGETRSNSFDDKYIFCSNEVNLISLLMMI